MKKVKLGKFSFQDAVWGNVSDDAKDFITQLLTKDQEKRPSAGQALQHPWILKVNELQKTNLSADVAMGALKNLQNFNASSKLKQATYAFIASQLLSKQEKTDIDKVFRAMDVNGDGKLSKEERTFNSSADCKHCLWRTADVRNLSRRRGLRIRMYFLQTRFNSQQ